MKKLGLALFSVPKRLNEDLEDTLDMLDSIGFEELEVFGPYTFSDEKTKQEWAATSQMLGFSASGFYGHTPQDFGAKVKDRGMSIPSMHTDIETLQRNMSALGEAARKIGATYVVLPALPEPYRKDMDDYKRSAELFNEIGKNACEEDPHLLNGLNVHSGHLTYEAVGRALNIKTVDPKSALKL